MGSKPAADSEGLRLRHKAADADAAKGKVHAQVAAAQVVDILSVLLFFRFINALCVRTFFQPDEYFQALEPAWRIAFGSDSGAWITWSVFAALGDFYTWKLAMDIYGRESNAPWAALWMTVLNPWQWYCSTRTFSNALETTLTIAALAYWPWELLADAKTTKEVPLQQNEVILCGTAVLAISLVSDRLYFGFWTFPPYKWLYFNISQSLAVFYGHMPWHYYLSQGVPLLTTTFLPFTLVGLYKATASAKGTSVLQSNTLKTLALAALTMISTLSLITHKEVRFIYPLLPILHILAAPYIAVFFTAPSTSTSTQPNPSSSPSSPVSLRHKLTLTNLLTLNLLLAGYLTLFHQPAPLSLFALFLTPCHTTPWRSRLVYPALRARALTCEPPLHTAPGSAERATYLDEADRFYLPPASSSSANDGPLESGQEEEEEKEEKEGTSMYGLQFLAEELWPLDTTTNKQKRGGGGGDGGGEEIPRYIVGFEGLSPCWRASLGPRARGGTWGCG
ncbi:hypothetical protein NEMBOFW57_000253 [Staphylotrichum longicolle]|uniref:Mannosyltransferase n=1 Tax=Staphylotrichum longicolle TaxID=669026 RepID=A0AAD4HWX7_9PEZI|nr:hypothetical protein NEMBOFW57_000253 [Staphylotrichum longicolle]